MVWEYGRKDDRENDTKVFFFMFFPKTVAKNTFMSSVFVHFTLFAYKKLQECFWNALNFLAKSANKFKESQDFPETSETRVSFLLCLGSARHFDTCYPRLDQRLMLMLFPGDRFHGILPASGLRQPRPVLLPVRQIPPKFSIHKLQVRWLNVVIKPKKSFFGALNVVAA